MKLKLRSIVEPGILAKERITLAAKEYADVGDFMLTRNLLNGEEVSLTILQAFWFPYVVVSAGDLVVLYTREGIQSSRVLENGKTAHFFFWGLDTPIWNEDSVAPVLLEAPIWDTALVSGLRERAPGKGKVKR